MMAAGFTSGAFLLAVLIGTSYSFPVKTGGDQSSSGGGDSANPGYGYGHGYPAPHGGYVPVSGSGSQPASHLAAPYGSSYYPVAPGAVPVSVQHPGGFPGAVPPGGQPVAPQAYSWEVDPVRPLPVETSSSSSSSPGAAGAAGSAGAAGGPGGADSSASSSAFFPALPTYQGGELSHVEKTFEHGNSDSETEDQGSPRRGPGVPVPFPLGGAQSLPDGSAAASLSIPYPPPGFGFPWYPYYDYQFLTGQYPPGTVSHFSTSYEQGKDQYHDNHYVRDLPIYYGHQQVPVYPPGQQQRQ